MEICTALYKHIKKHHSAADHLILGSDSTGGQNRNHMTTTLILRLLTEMPELKYVVHRFPIVGHSFLPNDRDFGVIANAKKKKQCLCDSVQYIKMIEEARKNPHPIQVIKIKPRDFVSFEDTANFKRVAENVDTDGDKFSLFSMHEMRYNKQLFGCQFQQLSSDAEFRTVNFAPPTTRSRRPNETAFSKLESVYPKDGVAIATKKYQDIHDKLLQYIPPVHHKEYMVKHATKRKNLYKYSK